MMSRCSSNMDTFSNGRQCNNRGMNNREDQRGSAKQAELKAKFAANNPEKIAVRKERMRKAEQDRKREKITKNVAKSKKEQCKREDIYNKWDKLTFYVFETMR